jgi:choline-sulfatase
VRRGSGRSSARGRRRARWLGALLPVLALALSCAQERAPLSLVIVSLDTVRADHLPTYGYARPTAPQLDALARRGVVFDEAFAQHVNTQPSHASMFTGLYPLAHGVLGNGRRLPAGPLTLAQVLTRRGYRSAGFVSTVLLNGRFSGLSRGFEHWDDAFPGARREGRETVRRALAWLGGLRPGEPYFLFVHLYDVHGPYLPRGEYARLFRSAEPGPLLPEVPGYQLEGVAAGGGPAHLNDFADRYDALIRQVDAALGELLAQVDLAHTVVVVLSDHGETLGERAHVLDHGAQVFDEQIRIPLVIHAPGLEPRRIGQLVETVDLLPTLLDLLGLARPAALAVQGRSLAPLLKGAGGGAHDAVFSSSLALEGRHRDRGYHLRGDRQIHALRGERWKLVLYPGREHDYVELYDLREDPAERVNRAGSEAAVRERQLAALRDWISQGSAPQPAAELSPEMQGYLRQLGYAGDPEGEGPARGSGAPVAGAPRAASD